MLCCGICDKMSKRRSKDYKVATVEIELEPLGGPNLDGKKNGINKYGNQPKGGPVKVSVVGGGQGGSRIWRRERIEMTEPELDDVAFLTGGGDSNNSGRPTRDSVAVCSQKRALCVTAIVLGTLLGTALIIAYAGPQNDCACAGKMPPGYVPEHYNNSLPFNPIATNGQPFPWLQPHLPNNVRPIRYVLTIHPNLTTLDVKGQVMIEFHVEKETNFIVLHVQDLNITEKAIVGPKGYALKITKLLEYPPRQQLYIELRDKLRKKANYTLNLRWYSRLVPESEGFYVDQYESINGFIRLLAATVFGPRGARKAFPCFDEPHLRAPFRISVFRDRFHIGLSNSKVRTTDDVGFYMGTGLLEDEFIETPPLPPDEIAWVVSDFQHESLEPSSTYQVASTATPMLYMYTTKAPTDNFTFRTDKRPFKNKTILNTKSLSIASILHDNNFNQNITKNHTIENLLLAGKNSTNITDHDVNNGSTDIIRTAPSYTFYASKKVLTRSKFVLQTSRDVLEYLQTWLGVPYPLAKLDFVALPSLDRDLTSSLGLITLRTSFICDVDTVTTEEYHAASIKIAEAIVRQFFGGITSLKTWNHSWLWEGIVKYLARIVLSPIQPSWPIEELYLLKTTTKAMDIDAIQGWDSILDGTNENGLNEDFYIDKTAAILSMLHLAMGENNFRGCLGSFLTVNKFLTAEPIDMWSICTKQVNGSKNIKEMMHLWTSLSGLPLITVTKIGATVSVSQKIFEPSEFLAILDEPIIDNVTNLTTTTTTTTPAPTSSSSKKHKSQPIKWTFPLNYITDVENVTSNLWINSTDVTFQLPSDDTKWIKMNAGQKGYYRVLYNEDNWNNLIDELKKDHTIFTSKDRIGLISDAFTLCHANLMPCQITMNLISYLPKERDWGPLSTGLRHLEQWRRILKYSEGYLLLAEYVKVLLGRTVVELGWNNNGKDEIKLLRPEILLASVLWEDPDTIAESKKLLHSSIANSSQLPPNLREVIYTGAVLSGEFIYWQFCWNRFATLRGQSEGTDERMELLRALGETKDAWLQNRLLSHVITLSPIELVQVLEAIAGTPTGGAMACRFLQAKWNDLQSKLGAGSMNFARVISAITQYGATKFDYDELKSLVERFGDGPGMKVLNMTLRSVAVNVEWVSRSQKIIFAWMENNVH